MKRISVLLAGLAFSGALFLGACSGSSGDGRLGATATKPPVTATTAPAVSPTAEVATSAAATATRPPATATTAPAVSPTAAAAASSPAAGGAVAVTIANLAYSPANLTARVGQKVTLNVSNRDAVDHTFTIDGVVDSGTIAGGKSAQVEFTPAQTGRLTFYCTVHGRETMSGSVTVSAGASAKPPDSPGGAGTSVATSSAASSSTTSSSGQFGADYYF